MPALEELTREFLKSCRRGDLDQVKRAIDAGTASLHKDYEAPLRDDTFEEEYTPNYELKVK